MFSSGGISDELQTLIGVPLPHQPHHPLEAQCLRMIGVVEAPLKARPDVAILARRTKITQRHVQWYLIGVADAPEGAADFISKA
jgi:hypothetical protein